MHDITPDWQIFGGNFQALDVNQGSLGNCYLLSALASMAVQRNGEYIKNIFITQVFIYILLNYLIYIIGVFRKLKRRKFFFLFFLTKEF